MSKLKLNLDAFWASPYSLSAFVALKEKGIPFETHEIALHRSENEDPAYQKASVTGLIPSLQHDDFWLSESGAIINYLEDVFPRPKYPSLLPEDPKLRGSARMVLDWIRSSRDLLPLIEERSTATMFFDRAKSPLSAAGTESANHLIRFAEVLIRDGHENLFGHWTIADCDLSTALHRLILNGDPLPAKISTYALRQWKRPSIQAFVNQVRPKFVPY